MVGPITSSPVATGAGAPLASEVYTARPGDTLDGVAQQYGITDPAEFAHFKRLNVGAGDGELARGTRIYVPVGAAAYGADGPKPSGPVGGTSSSAPTPADTVETSWTKGYGRSIGGQNRYNDALAAAKRRWPNVDVPILKSVLAQESGFQPGAFNRYGYGGVAQLGVREARSVGLDTGGSAMRSKSGPAVADRARDERFVPARAVPGAAALMKQKATTLSRGVTTSKTHTRLAGFKELGSPKGDDLWRFIVGSYNGGEGTVLWAMHFAYGNTPPEQVRWSDLTRGRNGDVRTSPLWRAIEKVGMNPNVKYKEISEYARDVVARARQ